MATPRIRFHPVLGVAVKYPGQDGWALVHESGPQTGRLTDRVPEGPGWREVPVAELLADQD